jgi:membrane associated rhomboid family serine protease
MSQGADLFVICKQCGSEVSPYITECPYCGNRLRRRAPKLPRDGERPARAPRRSAARMPRLRTGEIPGIRGDTRPYGTAALVLAAIGVWVATRAGYDLTKLVILGPLHGDWWRLLTYQFTYDSGVYAFATLTAVAVFGWLLERRHGPLVVIALFLAAGVTGGLAELAAYPLPVASGGNAGALALLAAWAVPDLRARHRRRYYEGDLLGVAAFAAVLLAMPAARAEVSWLAGVCGVAVGLAIGAGLQRVHPA